jgi:dTDP-4-amino-4,6-dideoxygalactose transaminase
MATHWHYARRRRVITGGRPVKQPELDCLPPLPLSVYLKRRRRPPPFPLGDLRSTLYARGRNALWQGLESLGLQPGDEALVPAYHHGAEIEAITQAGLYCQFYGGTGSLEPDEAELDELVGPYTRALLLIHYLGFPQDAGRWRRWCDERGLRLIEDAAQAWLATSGGEPAGARGDISIFCLYKTLGVPDGGVLFARQTIPPSTWRPALALRGVAGRHAAWLASRSPLFANLRRSRRQEEQPVEPEADFALGDPGRPVSFLAPRLARRAASPAVAERRRSNYAVLARRLGHLLPDRFFEPRDGASPFVYPIAVDDRPRCLEELRARGVNAVALWPVPHPSLPARAFPYARILRDHLVGLPVHQELRPADLERICIGVLEGCHGFSRARESLGAIAHSGRQPLA